MEEGSYVLIRDLRPGMRNINCAFIVLEKDGEVYKAKDGSRIRSCRVADKTGSISFSAWDDIGELIEPGEIFRLKKGYVSLWKGCMRLYMGKHGTMERLGEICMVYSDTPDMSDPLAEFLKEYRDKEHREKKHIHNNPPSQGGDQSPKNHHRFHSKHSKQNIPNGSRKPYSRYQPYSMSSKHSKN